MQGTPLAGRPGVSTLERMPGEGVVDLGTRPDARGGSVGHIVATLV